MATNYTQVELQAPIVKNKCPPDAKSIFIDTLLNQICDLTSIPSHVEHIKFGIHFNQLIEKNDLPVGLKSLKFSNCYDQPIEKDVLPAKLESLVFGYRFDQKIEKDVLPTGLQTIHFGGRFNQPIENDVLPTGLQTIYFGGHFNQLIEKDVLPPGVQSIYFGHKFNQPFDNNISNKTKLYFYNIPSKITHSYTIYQYDKSNLEKLIENKKVGEIEIYESKFNNNTHYMVDVEIVNPEINKEKIMKLINQLKYELEIL